MTNAEAIKGLKEWVKDIETVNETIFGSRAAKRGAYRKELLQKGIEALEREEKENKDR